MALPSFPYIPNPRKILGIPILLAIKPGRCLNAKTRKADPDGLA